MALYPSRQERTHSAPLNVSVDIEYADLAAIVVPGESRNLGLLRNIDHVEFETQDGMWTRSLPSLRLPVLEEKQVMRRNPGHDGHSGADFKPLDLPCYRPYEFAGIVVSKKPALPAIRSYSTLHEMPHANPVQGFRNIHSLAPLLTVLGCYSTEDSPIPSCDLGFVLLRSSSPTHRIILSKMVHILACVQSTLMHADCEYLLREDFLQEEIQHDVEITAALAMIGVHALDENDKAFVD
jgi:hypothetical protein